MKRIVIAAFVCVLGSEAASAQSLIQSMSNAYRNNPQLQGQRARQRATDEQVPQALSNWRPQVTITGQIGRATDEVRTPGSPTPVLNTDRTPRLAQVQVTQPIFRGGQTIAETSRAENNVLAGRAQLIGTEQTVLLDVVTSYINLLRDQAVRDLNANNVQVLQRQLAAARDRFRVGEITRTDVAQAEDRLAGARANLTQAEGNVATSRATFQRVVGLPPRNLTPVAMPRNLPASQQQAEQAALDAPAVVAARYLESAALDDVRIIVGQLLPQISLQGTLTHSVDTGQTPGQERDTAQILAVLTMPLYSAGLIDSRVRAARQTAVQRRYELEDARRRAIEEAARAFQSLNTARARINALRTQIRAAEIALQGVEQEARVGSRTTLDVLDAEQNLLTANTNLVTTQRDQLLAAFQLMQSTGRLTAWNMELPVEVYDPTRYYRLVRNRWWGTSIPPPSEPAAR